MKAPNGCSLTTLPAERAPLLGRAVGHLEQGSFSRALSESEYFSGRLASPVFSILVTWTCTDGRPTGPRDGGDAMKAQLAHVQHALDAAEIDEAP